MIAFRYTKTDGAEYLSHLDLLRHLERTFRRAGIAVKTSEGFHPHPKIFMNNPLGLGIKSVAEYCAAECGDCLNFMEAFNANSPKGIKCTAYKTLSENPNYAYTIENCTYTAEGVGQFDTAEFMGRENLIITDMRGRTADVKDRIIALDRKDGKLVFTLGCGNKNLRPDLFCNVLCEMFGGDAKNIIKISAQGPFTF